MFVMYNKEKNKVPVKIWLDDQSQIEESCIEQANNLSNLPFLHKWVCLMPDTHTGKGMPIGGVIATKDVIIPNAVGSDIGCGMIYVATNVDVEAIKDIQTGNGSIFQLIVGQIMRNIPTGASRYKEKQESAVLDRAREQIALYEKNEALVPYIEEGYYQTGSLGGGNHFIELQEDENGKLCIMIHSGSRHLGKEICDYFHKEAREFNLMWYSQVKDEYKLAFLPVNCELGRQYIDWMHLAMDYAYENRECMMRKVSQIVLDTITKYTELQPEVTDQINCHHNYAALENHFGENVWVHRKGATRARLGERAVIPGAMGSYSYVVEGKGYEDTFCSSSHGAGRAYSRSGAMKAFSVEEVIVDLQNQGVVLGKNKKSDVAEECRFAYKDIDQVMACQTDLVTPIHKLKTLAVVKG